MSHGKTDNGKTGYIFLLAFFSNFLWENLHASLYVDCPNTPTILLRATLFDAIFITLLGILFLKCTPLRGRYCCALMIGCVVGVLIELHALHTGRWGYSDQMPIVLHGLGPG